MTPADRSCLVELKDLVSNHQVGQGQHPVQIVNDVRADPRWDQAVDQEIEFVTRRILCVPMTSLWVSLRSTACLPMGVISTVGCQAEGNTGMPV